MRLVLIMTIKLKHGIPRVLVGRRWYSLDGLCYQLSPCQTAALRYADTSLDYVILSREDVEDEAAVVLDVVDGADVFLWLG